uniref:Uncharacterized protein n=1 Tax=Hyaloperonospora arabidopsidis (strain Emoy2) TaxID=559515 RepID=M4BLA8_HYAAE
MGTAEPLGAQSRGNNRRPSETRTTTNTASTATSCSGQGIPVQPRRGRLDFFPASNRTLFHPGFSATAYSIRPWTAAHTTGRGVRAARDFSAIL